MIVYIHGFGSAGEGNKYQILKNMFPQIKVISPTYSCVDFSTIDSMLDGYDIENEDTLLFIGNSLGGFIAMYLAKKYNGKAILLNPSTNPFTSLNKYLGENINFSTNEKFIFTQEIIDSLKLYNVNEYNFPLKIFVNKDDDVIDYKLTLDFFKDIREVTIFETGGHRFENLLDIKDEILFEYFNIS